MQLILVQKKSVTKQRDKTCKQDINRILLSGLNWHFGFESFGFGFLNYPSLNPLKLEVDYSEHKDKIPIHHRLL